MRKPLAARRYRESQKRLVTRPVRPSPARTASSQKSASLEALWAIEQPGTSLLTGMRSVYFTGANSIAYTGFGVRIFDLRAEHINFGLHDLHRGFAPCKQGLAKRPLDLYE